MAERTIFRSPGVYTREIEILPQNAAPVGTPAGAVGSSLLGPAFVPITVGNFNQFTQFFGDNVDGERQGVVAAREFLRNGTAFTFCRVLGAGIGGPISAVNVGTKSNFYYEDAGFIAGYSQLNGVSAADISGSWVSGSNAWVIGHATQDVDVSDLYLEGLIESAGAPLSSSLPLTGSSRASAILNRAVVFTRNDASIYLYSGSLATSGTTPGGTYSASLGTVAGLSGFISASNSGVTRQQFVMSVGEDSDPDKYFGPLTCSMDPERGDYFANILNTDPELFNSRGHILYGRYDIDPSQVTMSGTGGPVTLGDRIFDTSTTFASGTSFYAKAYNSGTDGASIYSNYGSRFRAPISPMVVSQEIGGEEIDLFRVESLHDGHDPSRTFKISISNISRPNTVSADPYGTFTLLVRSYNDTDQNPVILEQYNNCNLNPNSDNFVCRRVGTQKVFYDFDQADQEDRKLVTDGEFETISNYIRLIPEDALVDGRVPQSALPFGFRGFEVFADVNEITSSTGIGVPPVPYRQTIARGAHSAARSRRRDLGLFWGVQFQNVEIPPSGNGQEDPNSSRIPNRGIDGFLRLYGLRENNTMITGSAKENWEQTTYNADTYQNNKFSLNNVALMKGLDEGFTSGDLNTVTLSDSKYFRYFRGGVPAGTSSLGDLVNISGPGSAVPYNRISPVSKFSFFVQGGFDGTNFQNRESRLLSNEAVRDAENSVTTPGGLSDNTVNAYLHAINIMSNPDDVAINLFAIPGVKQSIVTDRAIEAIEDNFDALYIMDIDDRLESDPDDISSVTDVLSNFEARSLDTSFAAAYYPDVVVADAAFGRRVTIAPSAVVLGAFAFNDRVGSPFQATAGFNRGVLETVVGTTQRLNQLDRDELYSRGNINPIFQPPGRSFVIFGNKTLDGNNDSALTRASTRRLLIEIRRAVRRAAQSILFEQYTQAQIDRLNQLIDPILERIQAQGGLQQYRVVIDDTTNGPVEVENLTVAGKIFLQPTNVIEVISLDFVVDPTGVTFS